MRQYLVTFSQTFLVSQKSREKLDAMTPREILQKGVPIENKREVKRYREENVDTNKQS